MKKLLYVGVLFGMFALTACEKKSETNEEEPVQEAPSVSVENNQIAANGVVANLTTWGASYAVEVNSGKPFLELYIHDGNFGDAFHFGIKTVPSASKTLKWQEGDNFPGNVTDSEFFADVKVNDETWYGGFTSDGYGVDGGEMDVTISGDKITFTMKEVELGDSYLNHQITKRVKCVAQVTMSKSELEVALDGGRSVGGSLMAK